VVALDDASTDPDVISMLDELERTTRLKLIRHEVNIGYTANANYALHLDDQSDVVLLNSDTEVGPFWLDRLRWVASSAADVATVSAVSDNAGAMAVPQPGVANAWPGHLPWQEVALGATHADLPWAIEAPTGHGFCMLVTREAIRDLDGFDVHLFPRGYGEENDFCMRARERGLRNLVAPHVLVKHARGESFGSARETLIEAGRRAVDERHPTYTGDIRSWMASTAMAEMRARHQGLLDSLNQRSEVRPRRLYVLHRAGGGTPATNLDLMTALAAYQDSYLVESAGQRKLILHRVTRSGAETLGEWEATDRFRVTDTWRQDYAEVMAEWIIRLGIETVHVRHLINHPLTALADVTRSLGVPLVVSTHDFYLSCPTVHLLDQDDRFCGGHCTPGPGRCRMPTPFVAEATDLKHHWIHEWRRRAGRVFDAASAVIATTHSAAAILAASYPGLANSTTIIEHGRDIDEGWAPARDGDLPRRPGPLRILAVANWDPHKGTEYVRSLGQTLGRYVEIHVLGQRSDQLADVGIPHGPYKRMAFPSIVREIDPDLVALVSIWPETYSHTLTEAWALGVPVLATDIGAIAERIRQHGGGVLVPVDDPGAAAAAVGELLEDRAQLDALRAAVPRDSVRNRAAMAEDYRGLYGTIGPRSDKRVRLGYLARGRLGTHPGSAHVRVLRRLAHPSVQRRVNAVQVFQSDIEKRSRIDLDVVLVQRDALQRDPAPFIKALQRNGVRLVVELDDDLVTEHSAGRLAVDVQEDVTRRAALRGTLLAADHVIVSTTHLRERIRPYTEVPITVVPNQIDDRVWRNIVTPDPPPQREEYRLLYMGSRTHLADLLLLERVMPELEALLGRRTVLEVVGIADRFDGDHWVKRLKLPRTMQQYPDFVRWLRTHRARWHAGVAPLVDNEFNRAKSDLKLLEYAALGLPAVASAVGPYVTAQQLALLTPNTAAEWTANLALVLSDVEFAATVRESSSVALTSRLMDPVADGWLDCVVGADDSP
jgi:glycosyltransferase involved in cell wall biosynthesis